MGAGRRTGFQGHANSHSHPFPLPLLLGSCSPALGFITWWCLTGSMPADLSSSRPLRAPGRFGPTLPGSLRDTKRVQVACPRQVSEQRSAFLQVDVVQFPK